MNEELEKAVRACGTVCGIASRELGNKYTLADMQNAQMRPFFGMQQAISKLNKNGLDRGKVKEEIAVAMYEIEVETLEENFDKVMSLDLQGVFSLAYAKACSFRA